jgi:GT2 family glycosyltransferase
MPDNLPFVSIVVLNWNGREYLADCFDSLLALRYPTDRLELIMVDNGSTDDSVAFMRQHYAQVKITETGKNLGAVGGRNTGARVATGEYLAFVDNDAHVYPDWLIKLIEPMQLDQEVACTSSRLMNLTGDRVEFGGSSINFYGYGYQEGYDRSNIDSYTDTRPTIFPCLGALVIRRAVFFDSGELDEDYFFYYEDVDLGWRLWVLGYKVLYIGAAVALHKHHGTQRHIPDASRRVLFERNALMTLLKNYDDAHLAQLLPVALMLAFKRQFLVTGVDARTYRVGYPAPNIAPAPRLIPGARWLKVLRQEGPLEFFRRAQTLIRRTFGKGDPAYPPPDRHTLPGIEPGYEQVSRMSLAHLVAVNDVIDLLPRILDKRAKIQAARQRSDAEVFQLFGRPFDLGFFDATYEATQNQLARLFHLDQLFEPDRSDLPDNRKP